MGRCRPASFICACAASLFREDLLKRGYRGDRVVLAYVARHPGATGRQVAQALAIPERRVMANLDRLTADGLLASIFLDGSSTESADRFAFGG
ncbi:MarR family transcriptional regulator [Streptomyces sp. Amel2xE9]|uniref:MarR family transcriptional regulator n=1 Tax=Streptomyces sp. Amel2xE9 TaxID=1157634 RepID=UPI003B63E59B